MSKTLISGETLKTIGQGALGAMTFGAYHQFTTNKMMELNNEKIEIQHKYFMDKMENKYKIDMDKMEFQNKRLNEKIEKLEKKSWW
jgi:hypothetical protein